MSAAAAPPPPPPPGNGPGKGGPGHNSPGSNKGSPRPAPRVRGDGTSAKTALWSKQLWDNPRQRQFLVHRRTQPSSSRWARCTEQEARYDAETGFTVWELGARAGRLVDLLTGRDGRPQFVPFQWQLDEVIAEERARIARHEPIPGEEDILEGVEEEYAGQDPSPFDKGMSPRGKDNRSISSSASSYAASSPGSRSRGFGSPSFAPVTPRHQRDPSGNAGSPSSRGPGSTGSPSSRGRGSGGSSSQRRGQGSPKSPTGGMGQ